jgi:glycine/D-amino acid oxidase-like deaminating enzyme
MFPRPIYRPFGSIAEQNDFAGKSASSAYSPYVHTIHHQSSFPVVVYDAFGGALLRQTGHVHVSLFLDAAATHLEKYADRHMVKFDVDKLQVKTHGCQYEHFKADRVVFCQGYRDAQNPFFSWLPFAPVKGEVLTVNLDEPIQTIFNRNGFIIPQEDNTCLAGSTYTHAVLDEQPTENGRKEIIEKLNALISIKYTITAQRAGVRPGTKSRRPFVGFHPEYKAMSIFNGLGTKGVSVAPWLASVFANHLEGSGHLPAEADVSRYYSLYFMSQSF